MKKVLLLFLVACLISCGNDEQINVESDDCIFEQDDNTLDGLIDDTERAILDDCFNDRIDSENVIKANLLGEWQLVGHGEGWFPNQSQPCGKLNFSSEYVGVEFNDGYTDTLITLRWELKENSNTDYYIIETDPSFYGVSGLNVFCEDFIYYNYTPSDGNMYLYEKQ